LHHWDSSGDSACDWRTDPLATFLLHCSCPAYRTPEQQKLWALVAQQIDARYRGREYQEEKLTDFVRQLLELYP
jgi:hypothetical protein